MLAGLLIACSNQNDTEMKFTGANNEVKLMILDPGHFHAALIQKTMYNQIDPEVYIYAPDGPDVQNYLKKIEGYNTRPENPTEWISKLYASPDFFDKMLSEKPGNVMVTSGNNGKKTEYIKKAIDAGINVFADKPMAINSEDFELLKKAFESSEEKGVLLYDIMTERHEITSILQKEFSMTPEIFGTQVTGSSDEPAVVKESVHHFFKYVSGSILKRPAWFFDVSQQGEGIVDITTHLVDLIQWACFPGQIIDYHNDINIISSKRWSTDLTPSQFNAVTRLTDYPEYLQKDVIRDSILQVYANGEINYNIKGVHAKVSVRWNFEAPEGTGDTHYSIMRGTKANLVIRQGAEQNFKPVLYIEPVKDFDTGEFESTLTNGLKTVQEKYPGIEIQETNNGWMVIIPDSYKIGHEAHFRQVTEKYLKYLIDGKLPEWEVPNMIAKYYVTTKALELALEKSQTGTNQ